MIVLKGMTWDHIRGINPLLATSREFTLNNSGITLTWDARSLEDFEDYPIEKLAKNYDLIMLDHPFIGAGASMQVIEPLDDLLEGDFLYDQKENSVGGSFESYTWEGKQWALPIDAASQVAAYRKDLFNNLGISNPPSTLIEVDNFILELPKNFKIGIPLNPTHSYCSFVSLSANIGGEFFYKQGEGFLEDVGVEAINHLRKWYEHAHPISINSNPIKMLEHMSKTNEIVYIPLIFGYSNYSKEDIQRKIVTFTNIPSKFKKARGSILGGVGMALSTHSKYKQEAVQFMKYVAGESCQCGTYIENDGQPAYRKAWKQKRNNQQTNHFYTNTLESIDLSYTRPRYNGYGMFQKRAGELIHSFLKENNKDAKSLIRKLNQLHIDSLVI